MAEPHPDNGPPPKHCFGGSDSREGSSWPGPRAWLESLYDTSPEPHLICVPIVDAEGQIADFWIDYANPAASLLFTSPLKPGRRLLELLPEADACGLFAEMCRTVTGIKQEFHEEFRWPAAQEPPRWYDVWMGKLGNSVLVNFRDVTARRAAREALEHSENQLRQLFDHLPDLILVIDREARIRFANDRAPSIASARLIGTVGFTHLTPASRQRAQELVAKAFQTGEVQQMEAQTVYDEWWDCRLVPMGRDEVMIICTAITARKHAETRLLAEQQLLRKLFTLQEQERKLVSHEIHDGLLQEVTSAHMLLEAASARWHEQKLTVPPEIAATSASLNRAMTEGRRLISRLRPMIIDERGLVEAIEYLVEQEKTAHGVQIRFTKQGRFDNLGPILESSVFRIVQEAVTNIRRHSQSPTAEIHLSADEGRLSLEIRDHGVGFDLARVPEDRFGIRGILERARLFGGQGTIHSEPGQGTCVQVEMPLSELRGEEQSRP
jgi:PAS domain S-box-containing protein